MLFIGFVEDYIVRRGVKPRTAEFYRQCTKRFARWNRHPMSTLTASQKVVGFMEFLRNRTDVGQSRQHGYRRAFKALFAAAVRAKLIDEAPVLPIVKVPQHHPDGFTDEELTALLRYADPWQKAVIMLAYDTGYRRSDLFAVRWSEVGEDNIIRVIAGKTGRHKPAYVTDATLDACRALKKHFRRAEARVLPKRLSNFMLANLIPYPHDRGKWGRDWKKLGQRAGVYVVDRCCQCIRRTGASRVARERGIYEAANYLGHRGIETALKYYMVPHIVDKIPPSPPPLLCGPKEPARS